MYTLFNKHTFYLNSQISRSKGVKSGSDDSLAIIL